MTFYSDFSHDINMDWIGRITKATDLQGNNLFISLEDPLKGLISFSASL